MNYSLQKKRVDQPIYYNESVLLDDLKCYVSKYFNEWNTLLASEFVHQWVVRNGKKLSPVTKDKLSSIDGARSFVKNVIRSKMNEEQDRFERSLMGP